MFSLFKKITWKKSVFLSFWIQKQFVCLLFFNLFNKDTWLWNFQTSTINLKKWRTYYLNATRNQKYLKGKLLFFRWFDIGLKTLSMVSHLLTGSSLYKLHHLYFNIHWNFAIDRPLFSASLCSELTLYLMTSILIK